MSIAKLKLDESAKLEFDVSITGADGLPQSRFVIEGKTFSISYPCRQIGKGVEVDITELKNIFPAGEYPARLEIILENKIYVPFKDSIVLEPIVEVSTKSRPVNNIKESVKVAKVVVKRNEVEEEAIEEEVVEETNDTIEIVEEIVEKPKKVRKEIEESLNLPERKVVSEAMNKFKKHYQDRAKELLGSVSKK